MGQSGPSSSSLAMRKGNRAAIATAIDAVAFLDCVFLEPSSSSKPATYVLNQRISLDSNVTVVTSIDVLLSVDRVLPIKVLCVV